jgi:hypothetical protein
VYVKSTRLWAARLALPRCFVAGVVQHSVLGQRWTVPASSCSTTARSTGQATSRLKMVSPPWRSRTSTALSSPHLPPPTARTPPGRYTTHPPPYPVHHHSHSTQKSWSPSTRQHREHRQKCSFKSLITSLHSPTHMAHALHAVSCPSVARGGMQPYSAPRYGGKYMSAG